MRTTSCKNILIVSSFLIFFSFLSAKRGDFGVVPMINVTWDLNLGFAYGAGIALGTWGDGTLTGLYSSLSYSQKGYNISFGPYSGVGLATFRLGFNYMNIYENNDTYWGIETSPTIMIGHLRAGVMKNRNTKSTKLNLATGIGLF